MFSANHRNEPEDCLPAPQVLRLPRIRTLCPRFCDGTDDLIQGASRSIDRLQGLSRTEVYRNGGRATTTIEEHHRRPEPSACTTGTIVRIVFVTFQRFSFSSTDRE